MKLNKKMLAALLMAVCWWPAMAQETSTAEKADYEEVVVIGSRSNQPRSSTDTLVPVDVISQEDFNAVGGTADVTDNLNRLVPSFMVAPRNGDNNAFLRSVSMRGMSADQTLTMVNGKRRHRSNAINLFGPIANTGSHGVDISMLPAMAFKNVQVLRDGASAQYGSDAIAGVVNFELKDNASGGTVEATYGNHFEGEANWRIAGNAGMSLGEDGFANFTFETDDQEALSRGAQRRKAQALLDQGAEGVGADSPFGDAPLVQTWGRPESSAYKFALNAGYMAGSTDFYLFSNYAVKEGLTRFFYRPLGHRWSPTFAGTPGAGLPARQFGADATGDTPPNLIQVERVGFTPYYGSDQTDFSLTTGARGNSKGINWDLSFGMGSNSSEYTLYNSLNPHADLINGNAQRDFKTGDYEQSEMGVNLDLSQELTTTMFLAYGAEYRNETFTQSAGEEASYVGIGSSGLKGTLPENAGEFSRAHYGAYADMEHMLNDNTSLQYALRFENYEDFGSTINYKLAGRYDVNPTLALRGSLNTGFHAPTPGQSNMRTQSTSFREDGTQYDVTHIPADSEEARRYGGKALEEETSLNRTVGLVYRPKGMNLVLTADYYLVTVENKIFKTSIDDGEQQDPISFYTNALDVQHSGLDLVATSNLIDYIGLDTDVTLAVNINSLEVQENRRTYNGDPIVSDNAVDHIENDYPSNNFVLMTNTRFRERWNLMARWRYIGEHYDQGSGTGSTPLDNSVVIDPTSYVDVELGYKAMKNLRVAVGGSNILDSYPTTLRADSDGFYPGATVYPRRSAASSDGGSWYVKGTYTF